MPRLRTLTTLAATAALALTAAPSALAGTVGVGHASGTPTMNICLAAQNCTYVNYKNGHPTDVVSHTGKIDHFSLNAGSVGGQVQLRVLRPNGGGTFKVVQTSATHTVTVPGLNTFSAHISVKAGDVLALSNATSGIYMATAPSGTCVRYFNAPLSNGATGAPTQDAPQLHLLLSAHVTF